MFPYSIVPKVQTAIYVCMYCSLRQQHFPQSPRNCLIRLAAYLRNNSNTVVRRMSRTKPLITLIYAAVFISLFLCLLLLLLLLSTCRKRERETAVCQASLPECLRPLLLRTTTTNHDDDNDALCFFCRLLVNVAHCSCVCCTSPVRLIPIIPPYHPYYCTIITTYMGTASQG